MSLKVVNLSKRFKDRWVLRDVSFEVEDAQIFGVAGTSGSGKTALLHAIAGIIPTNGGDVSRNGGRPVLYSAGSGVKASGWKAIFRSGRPMKREDRLQNLIDRIEGASGVLLLDEPFSELDSGSREQVENALVRARDRGLTVVIASSDFEHMMSVCDRAAILAGTEVKQIGSPQELYEMPESRAVAYATGRCNFFAARRLSSSKAEIPEFQTVDGGHRLFARHVDRGALGAINQNVTLGVRPEHISISFGASFPEDNLLRATIMGVRFLGPTTLLQLDATGLQLQSLVLRLVGLNIGDECVLGLPIDKVHIFRD